MATNQNDLRWRRTDEQIRRAFVTLLKKKSFEKITVGEVVATAQISRKAFYLHYEDKYNFLLIQENKILKKLQAALTAEHTHFAQVLANPAGLRKQSYLTINQVLEILNGERPILKALLSANGDPQFKIQLRQLLDQEIQTRIKLYHARLTTKIPQRYAMEILSGGLVDLITAWLQNPHPESTANFSQILTDSRMLAPLDLLVYDD
ncbi:TetR/AcrR family transcriptional regulator [Limosilactobacillus kribbianus]|uniref:TetR/AcrR family transcriptional regulator n=1 Tax=Limosilactobacillus kribbianus TaxID=2982695 RepID=UPI00226473A3|nr:TetR/AcrR family transcriptional regulator [Limosilactobacillus kribbianus]